MRKHTVSKDSHKAFILKKTLYAPYLSHPKK